MKMHGFNGKLISNTEFKNPLGQKLSLSDVVDIEIGVASDLGVGIAVVIGSDTSSDELWEDENAIVLPLSTIIEAIIKDRDDSIEGIDDCIAHLECAIALLKAQKEATIRQQQAAGGV